ncbi:DUF2779 domain-containing protein [Spiroplasma endosymbiont of Agriotes lineatus]|uniref:DUF2779 domain-containing protein n=1 Tax=Spiroplasma endosymbiont of Agriotes lineatus TaxID=3077930 RepID=UPI0030CB386D
MVHKIYKKDYKNYRECAKLSFLLRKENHQKTIQWHDRELTYFFSLFEFDDESQKDDLTNISARSLELLANDDYSFTDLEVINSETILDGLEVGYHAKQYFLRNYHCFDLDTYEKHLVANKTVEKILDTNLEVLFEPRFEYNDCVTKVDVLKRNGTGWDLIEVKATTKVHREHLYDVLYQYYILTNCNIEIKNIYLMHLNGFYFHQGDLEYDNLFTLANKYNLTTTGSKQENIMVGVKKDLANRDFNQDVQRIKDIFQMPVVETLAWLKTNQCHNRGKYNYCVHVYAKLPKEHTIFNLYRLVKTKKARLYYEDNFLSLYTSNFFDLNLTINQYRQIKVVQNLEGVVSFSERRYLQSIYKEYVYPIYMYDFETVKSAIPKYENSTPYEQIPFQYSVHILLDNKFNEEKHNIKHYSYLADGVKDHRLILVEKLIKDLTRYGIGTYVAYNKSFEKQVLKKMTLLYPIYEEILMQISDRTIDLMDFFKNFAIYKAEFNGSFSIKKTLPAFKPEFSYDDLEVQKGTNASSLFRKRLYNELQKDNNHLFFLKLNDAWKTISLQRWQDNYVKNLSLYCERDTYGMVVLFAKISELLQEQGWIEW